ncbi:ribulose-phosphate 3-epimerase [Schleiferilactobacillus harbinensis]|jgi:ribulose-phosphate 3-epimerase|uniref:ribulose-phosphate 3-epimerase n=1 Tax=Schleiferilactobacillus harbinensis TaxID=304207 RepID=UPI001AAFB69C|nr:ribulose-phosphate 3-epimerase [Schleiferilactobacillus harbinensis]MBO3091043.1 ribulose-phosphate 3-epimerase [Schleiferilactobacillus harbinensis]
MTLRIAPSILSADFANLATDVAKIEDVGDLIHIDVMDGHFVPNLAFGPQVVAALRPLTKLPLEVHLMVEKPENFVDEFIKAGADTILVHAESTPHLYRVIQLIKEAGVKAGVVVNPGTPIESVSPILHLVDEVLVMTVNPGFGGQKFLPDMLRKVTHVAQLRDTMANADYTIEVDGGVNADTIDDCANAGADTFVAGSFVFDNADPAGQVRRLRRLIE